MNVPIIGAGVLLAGGGAGGGNTKKESIDDFDFSIMVLVVALSLLIGGLFFWAYFISKTVQERAVDVANCEMKVVTIEQGPKQSKRIALQQVNGVLRFDGVYFSRYSVTPTVGDIITVKIYKMPNGKWECDHQEIQSSINK